MATRYVILREVEVANGVAYPNVGEAEGGNDDAAINLFLETGDNGEVYGEGKYRGVPKRSWTDQPRDKRKKISFK